MSFFSKLHTKQFQFLRAKAATAFSAS